MLHDVFILLIVYQFKHYFADFPLQGTYMLGKFKVGTEWILPLAAHAGVHGGFTLAILFFFSRLDLWWLALLDFLIHFTMDRIKASPHFLGRFTYTERYYWWALGFDQMVHHFTHYFIIWKMVTAA